MNESKQEIANILQEIEQYSNCSDGRVKLKDLIKRSEKIIELTKTLKDHLDATYGP